MPTASQLRDDLSLVADLAASDLDPLWRASSTPRQAEEALRDVLPALIETYGAAAATIGADWYDDARDEAAAPGRFTAVVATVPDDPQPLVSWALGEARDLDGFTSLVTGGAQRRILNFSRETIARSSVADPAARGWKRVGVGQCDFCRMLIGRGAVYNATSVQFRAHDHCHCTPAPEWA